ncbi:KpsF/GutQ family sugar-phosphate isomerase [Brevundimonas sp. 2R-24]|uniref:KpsF/GutQ family sugar-phosphate isomerase n=1 Tax=Peiella sedimenti TaxID=3061083 RepID=A0ABT8SMA5_9CAUL|nr:KpsF/GutQ family sugar-phosphate isomerase [Caulobacteraceae bacterium XZ-24]
MSDDLDVARQVLRTEAEALIQMGEGLGQPFTRAVELCAAVTGRVVLTGVGKSGHVGRKIAATLASTGAPAMFVHATEASHGDLGMIGSGDLILALSKSGETKELADVVAYAKRFGVPLIGMTGRADSALGRAADVLLLLPDAPEAAQGVDAPTTSTTLQMALGDALAVALMARRGFTAKDFRNYHPGGKLGAALKTVGDLMHGGPELPLVEGRTPMPQALLTMTEKRFGCVGVLGDDGALAGLITDGDLRRHMDGLMSHAAAEVMTPSPKTVSPDDLAADALKVMNDARITVLFVVDQGRPVGVLHVHDLLRAGVI